MKKNRANINNIRALISRILINEVFGENGCVNKQLTNDIIEFVSKFESDEELLRGGGIPISMLDKFAFGFSEDSVKQLNPEQLKIRWHDDLENVKWEIAQKGVSEEVWAQSVDLSEPIDVDYWENKEEGYSRGFYIQDG
ncbi:MAG: hypothetical protein P8J32_00550, partial [bacterium]|nr:hypothetical protein [bacterium]